MPDSTHDIHATHWSVLLRAGSERNSAWEHFYSTYRVAVRELYRNKGVAAQELDDLVQEFFTAAFDRDLLAHADPERGRFRSYLRSAAERFLISQWRKDHRQKRAPGNAVLSLDESADEAANTTQTAPEHAYDVAYAKALFERVVAATRAALVARGQEVRFTALIGFSAGRSYEELAAEHGATPDTIRGWVRAVRKALSDRLARAVSETVPQPNDVQEELEYLSSLLGQSALQGWRPLPGEPT